MVSLTRRRRRREDGEEEERSGLRTATLQSWTLPRVLLTWYSSSCKASSRVRGPLCCTTYRTGLTSNARSENTPHASQGSLVKNAVGAEVSSASGGNRATVQGGLEPLCNKAPPKVKGGKMVRCADGTLSNTEYPTGLKPETENRLSALPAEGCGRSAQSEGRGWMQLVRGTNCAYCTVRLHSCRQWQLDKMVFYYSMVVYYYSNPTTPSHDILSVRPSCCQSP